MKSAVLILLAPVAIAGYLFLGSYAVLLDADTADDGSSMTCRYFTGTGTFSATMPRRTEFRKPPTAPLLSRGGRPACPRLVHFGLESGSGGTILNRVFSRDSRGSIRRGSTTGSDNNS